MLFLSLILSVLAITLTVAAPVADIDNEAAGGLHKLAKRGWSGRATWYNQHGNYGACGKKNPDSAYIVALNAAQYGNMGRVSGMCGKTVRITNKRNKKSVTAKIADACPGCGHGSLDLSVAAFKAIGNLDTGVLDIDWSVSS